jgi:hypothetical protein
MTIRQQALERFETQFGPPSRRTVKVVEWALGHELSAVIQIDQPSNGQAALIWLPYPSDSATVPEIAVEYPGEAGRHSNTYPAPGLKKGLPAMRLTVSSQTELDQAIAYIKAMQELRPLPEVKADEASRLAFERLNTSTSIESLPTPKPVAPRREAIPRAVQREVWQRDGGRCVECGTREKLCFDHIVPFSRGGSNTVRNLQILCERCNCSKGNRL